MKTQRKLYLIIGLFIDSLIIGHFALEKRRLLVSFVDSGLNLLYVCNVSA